MDLLDGFKNRKVVYGAGSLASVLLVAGVLIVVALLADWHQVRWDLTRGQSQSLTPVTRNLLKQVDRPLAMIALIPEGSPEREPIKDLLQRYAYYNPKVGWQLLDPEREPLKAKEAGYRFPGNVLLEYEGRRQMADRPDEDSLSNALRRILKPLRKKVYLLSGHGERDPADQGPNGLQTANRALENEGYEVGSLNLVTQPEVPQDAAAVIVASPNKPLLGGEVEALKGYLNQGGRLLVMMGPFQDAGVKGFLAGYGITLDDGIILDVNQVSQSLRLSLVMPLAVRYGPTRITRDFKNLLTIYPMSRPLALGKNVKGVVLQTLVSSMPSSYEKIGKEWLKSGKGNFDPKTDKKGPFIIGALAEIKPEGKPGSSAKEQQPGPGQPEEKNRGYLAVYGNVDFASNAYFNLLGNGDLFLNTENFLAAEEQQIMVRKALKAQLLVLTGRQLWILLLASLVGAPLVMLLAGIRAYRLRRSRK